MNVKLVSYTVPMMMETPEIRTPEDLMVYCARVSNPSNQTNVETGHKLLRYCMEHGHWSVFEQASMTVEIQTSRASAVATPSLVLLPRV
jgi:thymidylate synthase (FAD)